MQGLIPFPSKPRFYCVTNPTKGVMKLWQFSAWKRTKVIYNEGGKRGLMENINAALPFMDEDMRELAKRTLAKIAPLTENEYTELAIFAADEV